MHTPPSKLLNAINAAFPHDTEADIYDWYDSAVTCDQPRTVKEYGDWRRYDEQGNLHK